MTAAPPTAPPPEGSASASHDALIAGAGLPRLEARLLLATATGRSNEWLIGHGDEPADAAAAARFERLAAERRAGTPIAYLTGWREFYGRRFTVTPAVLIPRPETERLIEIALQRLAADRPPADNCPLAAGQPPADLQPLHPRPSPRPRLLDLGTGSGVIAITLTLERPDAEVTATDRSEAALAVARANAAALGAARVAFRAGDWWQALDAEPPTRYDLIASNPPYVAAGDPHLLAGDLRFEPAAALAAGADGLDACRLLIAGALPRLVPGGWLLLEHGWDQGAAVRALMDAAGFVTVATHADLAGHDRVTIGAAAGSGGHR
ncbi:MAG: peptide chain release factor N(5)-glutamine methyltransferase [Lautropia sp.]